MKECHVLRGIFSMTKKGLTLDYAKAVRAYYIATTGAIIVENADCVKKSINRLYWDSDKMVKDAEEEEEDQFGLYLFLGIAIGAVFVIAILLLVIYFKRRKNEDDDAGADTKQTS